MSKRLLSIVFIFIFISSFAIQQSVEEMTLKWKEAVRFASPYPEGTFFGRGIIIPAGGVDYLINAWVSLNMLRETGCDLPVEIWYIGEEEYIEPLMERLKKLGAVCKDITKYFDYPIKGWEVKPHAIVASSFKEVLLMDADNIPLCDPGFLFEDQGYKKTGALFWPDMKILEEFNLVWKVLELEPKTIRCQESGQILIDKERCWLPLQLAVHMNRESSFYYKHLLGDKDTYLLSWTVLDFPFSMILHLPGLVLASMEHLGKFSSFLQRDREGNPIFCHSVNYNWAERNSSKSVWKFFVLPRQPSHQVEPKYPLIRSKFKIFPFYYPHLEEMCISYWKEVNTIYQN